MVKQSDGLFKGSRWVGVVICNGIRIFAGVLAILFLLLVVFEVIGGERPKFESDVELTAKVIIWIYIVVLIIDTAEAVFGCYSGYTLTNMYTYAVVATVLFGIGFIFGSIGNNQYLYWLLIRVAVVICSWIVVCGLRDDPNGGSNGGSGA